MDSIVSGEAATFPAGTAAAGSKVLLFEVDPQADKTIGINDNKITIDINLKSLLLENIMGLVYLIIFHVQHFG
jgi:cellulose biosynthesis protein BcsQ